MDRRPEAGDGCPICGDHSDIRFRIDVPEIGWYIAVDGCRICNEVLKGPYAFCPDCGSYLPEPVTKDDERTRNIVQQLAARGEKG